MNEIEFMRRMVEFQGTGRAINFSKKHEELKEMKRFFGVKTKDELSECLDPIMENPYSKYLGLTDDHNWIILEGCEEILGPV
jgi:hypothetical protein